MQLTEHTDYSLRVLVLLAVAAPQRLSASEIARRHRLSFTHIQKVIQSLQNGGFVKTFRGRSGGVQLARSPDRIRIGAVVRTIEPGFQLAECFRAGEIQCRLHPGCALTSMLSQAKEAMLQSLDQHTLADVVANTSRARELLQP